MVLLRRHLGCQFLRYSRPSSTFSNLESRLKARQLPILYDYLSPQSSHLLSTTLVDFLPFLSSTLPTHLPSTTKDPRPLPISHHLVYFPTPTALSSLLPDGTDTLHSPGGSFTNRLWAGGHIRFPRTGGPLLDGSRAAIVEGIRSVRVSGPTGAEKVFVGIERRVSSVEEGEPDHSVRARIWTEEEDEAEQGDAIIIERRDLCFLRPEDNNNHKENHSTKPDPIPRRSLAPPSNPHFTHPIPPPTPHLLARYSALTYNAHAIHLDPLYTATHYHLPGLLVHGPLLLTLMLTCLKHELAKSHRVVREIRYRCLKPVFVGEVELRVCGTRLEGKKKKEVEDKGEEDWEVWIQKDTPGGGGEPELVVKGNVKTQYVGS